MAQHEHIKDRQNPADAKHRTVPQAYHRLRQPRRAAQADANPPDNARHDRQPTGPGVRNRMKAAHRNTGSRFGQGGWSWEHSCGSTIVGRLHLKPLRARPERVEPSSSPGAGHPAPARQVALVSSIQRGAALCIPECALRPREQQQGRAQIKRPKPRAFAKGSAIPSSAFCSPVEQSRAGTSLAA